jgi:hypothetical protein
MPVSLSAKILGKEQALAVIGGIGRRAGNLAPFFSGPFDASVLQFFRRQFDSAGRAGGEPWAPLRPMTLALKQRFHRGSMGVLRFENRLWASLTKRIGPDTVFHVGPTSYERGTSVPWAALHQRGFVVTSVFGKPRRYPRRVPARKLVPDQMPGSLVKAWQSLAVKYVMGAKT